MTEDEIKAVVREAVKETISDVLDIDDVREVRSDLRWARRQRKGAEALANHAKLTAMGMVVAGILYAVYWAVAGRAA